MKKRILSLICIICLAGCLPVQAVIASEPTHAGEYRDLVEYHEYDPHLWDWDYGYDPNDPGAPIGIEDDWREWDDYDDYGYDDYDDDDYDDDDYDDHYDTWISDENFHHTEQADESELFSWNNGLGSAGELDGRIVIVSIFLNDANNHWDFTSEHDSQLREHTLEYLRIAADWITQNASLWGQEPQFIFDWENNADLYYEMDIDVDIRNADEDPTPDMNEMIRDFVDPEQILEEYEADSILYMAFINSPSESNYVSFTIPYDDSLGEDTCEICYIMASCEGMEEAPAAYAHEILHTFGAPDLYVGEDPAANYNINDDFVSYCETHHPNEIMVTTYDVDTDEPHYDYISNELTEITAYYIGWTDTSKEAEEFHLQESQHIS